MSDSNVTTPQKDSFKSGWDLFVHSLRVFAKYPVFLLPLFAIWIVYATTLIYFKYFFPWSHFTFLADLSAVFLEIVVLCFLILCACSIMLEIILQLEIGEPLRLFVAVGRFLRKDVWSLFPLSLLWAVLWFGVTLIQAFLQKHKRDDAQLSYENVAKTLANLQEFSFSNEFFYALNKGIRMVVFLILPAIIWQRLPLWQAVKKGFITLRGHIAGFTAGYALSYATMGVIMIPPSIIFELGSRHHGNPPLVTFPHWVYGATIFYVGWAWSFCVYIEQMLMAGLYFWDMNWQEVAKTALARGEKIPALHAVPIPQLLGVSDMKFIDIPEPPRIPSTATSDWHDAIIKDIDTSDPDDRLL
jgi:hypothetical protein